MEHIGTRESKLSHIGAEATRAKFWIVLVGLCACSADYPENAARNSGGGGTFVIGERGAEVDIDAERIDETEPGWPHENAASESFVIQGPSNATACTSNAQCPTGYCVDGYCCDQKCDNKCMACSVAKKGSGADGICGPIKYDTDPDNDCPYGACDGANQCKNYNGFSCISNAQCLSKYCVDGVCCGNICMNECQACTAAKKGAGIDGACGNIAAGTNPDNECDAGGTCNGSGKCSTSVAQQANGAACTTAAQCSSGYCADGVCCDSWCLGSCQACTAAKKNQGVDGVCGNVANDKDPDDECWGGACNGYGVCKQYNGVPCSDKWQCLSGYCVDGVCCGNICTGMCYACSEARKGYGYDGVCQPIGSGKDPDAECNPGECNGAGTCNQPQTPQANGTTCVSGGQCASGYCVDGYCCDDLCSTSCKACSAAKKGSGANGVCGNIAAETDPDGECGIGARCGGSGYCRYYNGAPCALSAECFSNYCVDGVCCGNICTSSCHACSAAKKGQGADGSCGPIANTKDPDGECNPGECNGSGACTIPQTPQINGATCSLSTQCQSGYCVDGVCCDSSCSGTCQACSAAKKGSGANGACGNIKYDTDPDNECAAGACSGSGACQTYNGVACTATTDCLSNYCVDGFCCNNICSGSCKACNVAGAVGVCQTQCPSACVNGMELTNAAVYSIAGGPLTVAAADFNNDGRMDAAIRSWDTGAYVALGQSNGTLGTATAASATDWRGYIKTAADKNRNGYIEMNEQFADSRMLWADVNKDGIIDQLIYRTVYGDIGLGGSEWKPTEYFVDVYAGSANGTSTLVNTYNVGSVSPLAPGYDAVPTFGAADFNGDGNLDVAIGAYNKVLVWLGQGNGAFTLTNISWFNGSSFPGGVHVADVNQDGNADVLVGWNNDTVVIHLGLGDGTFASQTLTVSGTGDGQNLRFADVTNDGKVDLLFPGGTVVKLRRGNGDGTFGAETSHSIGTSSLYGIYVADMDSDDRIDVVTANRFSNSISVLFNRCLP